MIYLLNNQLQTFSKQNILERIYILLGTLLSNETPYVTRQDRITQKFVGVKFIRCEDVRIL